MRKNTYFALIFYGLIIMLLKIGILLDWLDMFVPASLGRQQRRKSAMYWICHGLIWTVLLTYVVRTLLVIFQCSPREKAWLGEALHPAGSCQPNIAAQQLATGAINVVTDFAVLVLPLSVIWRLNMTPRKKAGMSLLFAIGVLACVAGVMRLVTTVQLVLSKDLTYITSTMGFWGNAEMTSGFLIVGILAVPKVANSVSTSRPVVYLVSVFKRSRSSIDGRSDEGYGNSPSGGGGNKFLNSWHRRKQGGVASNGGKKRRPDQWGDVDSGLSGISFAEIRSTKSLVRVETGDVRDQV